MDVQHPPAALHKAKVRTHDHSYSGSKTVRCRYASLSRVVERGISHIVGDACPYVGCYTKEYFPPRAALLTTMQDYPGYTYVLAQVNHRHNARVKCMDETPHLQLPRDLGSSKTVFQGTQKWLRMDHPWRKRGDLFNGKNELERAPRPRSDEEMKE